ncbi:similar to Saccharomyces cerevisiae YNL219C ALG9 Mannosyltransferase, involved in N-linked glycosylation [Maudiozyma saulgeensis]|uniref:Mannosyltransferase n=1 Tax=Maudiozyma saulgeensis TaxID=1789683 RepID=A0A1X7R267_9SACH|nr:similar to Saccharomyces cerevisiae YNL219C ALG9 Mannosyltransferase, involved in N-linked glycosylation [Kazachstania saulgeensis]
MTCKKISFLLVTLLFTSRIILQPRYSLISDCDETFNYWEPLNFLVRGFGKQTWEYSPEYSIRSWAFLLPFYAIIYPFNKFTELESVWNFYITRITLGLLSFILEVQLHSEIKKSMSHRVANIWLLFQIFNPGYFHASVELLPSSVAMILYIGSIKYALRYLSTNKSSSFTMSLTFNFIAGILGWPFVLVLSLPLCVHYVFYNPIIVSIRTAFDCTLMLLSISAVVIGIDSIFYGKFASVSWNILFYNVLNADENSGPNIFGVEPWYYYLLNLVLNFPLPVLLFSFVGLTHVSLAPLWISFTLWMVIFIMQPHKEERFLYPIYGLVSLSAAIGFSKLLTFSKLCKLLKKVLKSIVILAVIIQASSRIIALIVNYTAPLDTFAELYNITPSGLNDIELINVCAGREWYHFPSSFHLPDGYRLQFIKSGFDGLLPGNFPESIPLLETIRTIPEGMNNLNKFDAGKIVEIDECTYIVDMVDNSNKAVDAFNPIEEIENQKWNRVFCNQIIDVDHSKILGRAFYVPPIIADFMNKKLPSLWNRMYGVQFTDYCLFERAENAPREIDI